MSGIGPRRVKKKFRKHMYPICLLKREVNRRYWSFTSFWQQKKFHRTLVKPFEARAFFENRQNFYEKKVNLLTVWWRLDEVRPNVTYGNFLVPVSSKFNGESNAHTHLVCRWRQSSKNRDFSRNGKIFLKSRTCPGLGLEGLKWYKCINKVTEFIQIWT